MTPENVDEMHAQKSTVSHAGMWKVECSGKRARHWPGDLLLLSATLSMGYAL